MLRPNRTAALIAATALTLAACGGTTNSGSPAEAAGSAAAGTAAAGPSNAASPLPDVEVLDVTSGERVQLAGYLPAEKPTLVWLWAPH